MLLPMGKTILYFFEICWLNSYPAVLIVHRFPFLWLGCWQVLDDFQYIPSKYWYFAQMTPSEFNKLPVQFSIKVFSLKHVSGILLVYKFNDLMWSSTANFKSFTEYKLVIWYSNYHNYMHSFFKVCYKIKSKGHEDICTIVPTFYMHAVMKCKKMMQM